MIKYPLLLLISIFTFLPCITSQQCEPIPFSDKHEDAMPNILGSIENVQLTVEANLGLNEHKTIYCKEVYDKVHGRGVLNTLNGGDVIQFLYLKEYNEAFTSTDTDCQTQYISKQTIAPHDDFGVYGWSNPDPAQPIFGPLNLLRDGYNAFVKKLVGKENGQSQVRGIKTNVWKQCLNSNKLTIRYFFVDSKTENGMGTDNQVVPARITVEGLNEQNKQISHTYDIINYGNNIPDVELIFRIPDTVGCERITQAALPKMPVYSDRDFNLKSEVVYTPIDTKQTHSYVSNLELTFDKKSEHFAYTTTQWKAHKDATFSDPGDVIELVYDAKNGLVYKMDKSARNCTMASVSDPEGDLPLVKFPDKQTLEVLDEDIFFTDAKAAQAFHYLGKGIERDLPVNIYEKKYLNEGSELVIITHYVLADDAFLDNVYREKNAPVKVTYWRLADNNNHFMGLAVFNIYAFSSIGIDKPSKFDVSPCFPEDHQNKWIQLSYPINKLDPKDVVPLVPTLSKQFLDNLGEFLLNISPLRIPQVIVDYDKFNIYVTALVLERANFFLDFELMGNFDLPNRRELQHGLATKEGCAKKCLEDRNSKDKCQYLSFCGALCKWADNQTVKEPLNYPTNRDCSFYKFVKPELAMPTLNAILLDFALAVHTNEVILRVENKTSGDTIELIATSYKEFAVGFDGINEDPQSSNTDRYSIYKSGFKLDPTDKSPIAVFKTDSYELCQSLCTNNPNCESLSYCMATRDCGLSLLHGEEITEEVFVKDTQCIILTRNYMDYFERYPNLVLAKNAKTMIPVNSKEDCAKACFQQLGFECLSFDHCVFTDEMSQEMCLMHGTNFVDLNEKDVKNSKQCGHYSKKVVYEFEMKPSKKFVDTSLTLYGYSTAEECALGCKQESDCVAFDTCYTYSNGIDRKCRLVLKSDQNNLKTNDNAFCNVYINKRK